jgi:hypothetical protein
MTFAILFSSSLCNPLHRLRQQFEEGFSVETARPEDRCQAGRDRVLIGLVKDKTLRRDLMDLAVIEEREAEPSRPLRSDAHRREAYR